MSTQDIPTKAVTLPADQWQAILDAVKCHWDEGPPGEGWQSPPLFAASAALSVALSQPELVGASKPPAVMLSALLCPAYEPGDGSADGAQLVGAQWWHPEMGCDSLQIVVDNARAILARWGRPANEPVPVAEQPWEREGWCDEDGWCWGFDADDTDPCWIFDKPETCICWTHCLPAHALPIPTSQEVLS